MPDVLQLLPHRGGGAETYIDLLEGGRYRHERVAFSTSRSWLAGAPSITWHVPVAAWKARSFDVVHAHGDVAAMLALPALSLRPSVWSPQGLHLLRRAGGGGARAVNAALRRVIAATARTLCQSQAEVDDLARVATPRDLSKLVIIDNGVRLPSWPATAERARARAALGLGSDDVVALYLGQLEGRKDPLTPIRATEDVDHLTLLVAGDGPLRGEVEAHASGRVRVLGHADPAPLLHAADVFVMPSHREGQSFAVLEAMANGLAMVVSDGSGNPEAVGEAGVVVPVGDVDSWRTHLARLVADPDERARLQRAARERAEARFAVERFRHDIEAVYDSLLEERGRVDRVVAVPTLLALRRRVGAVVDQHARRATRVRNALAKKYLRGDGIEIGALHKPLPMPPAARARYVDRMSSPALRRHYPELASWTLVEPDIIDDGERLATVADNSLDFVVANHFIEHAEDPLAAIRNHLRVLKPGGVIFMAVPDKRETFDRDREITTIDHVLRDHHEGPQISRPQHYEEWARDVDHADDVQSHAQALREQSYSIHFHVWTPDAFRDLLEHARTAEQMPFVIEEVVQNGFEFIVVLRKTQH